MAGDNQGRRLAPGAPLLADRRQAFREALMVTGGNVRAAARMVGYDPSYALRLVHEEPELMEVVEEARNRIVERTAAVLKPWEELAPRAQATLEAALDAERVTYAKVGKEVIEIRTPDWKARIAAAQAILDRTLGKPTVKVEGEVSHRNAPVLDPETAHRAMAVSIVRGWPAVQAVEWVRTHPEEAERVLQAVRALASNPGDDGGDDARRGVEEGREGRG